MVTSLDVAETGHWLEELSKELPAAQAAVDHTEGVRVTQRIARAALFAVVPMELVFAVLLVSGVSLPGPLIVAAEASVSAVLILETAVAYRLYRAERRGGANRRAASRATYERMVPEQVRRIMGFDLKGMISLALWVARRRHGVPHGATAVSYSRAQTSTMMLLLFAMVLELVVVDVLLRAFGAPSGLRVVFLAVDGYTVLIVLAAIAACVTRPHVVSADEVRIRYGAFFDLRVPRERIAEANHVRNFNENGMVMVEDDRLAVAVASQTNLVLRLTEPVIAVRPLGRRVEARTIRFFADDPGAAISALRSHREHVSES
ncbi:hypothetical protein Misp02_39560 [Microtetraspora sp. NBRC 16547]|nr:hypothetical protein Misp02_39560 [Microtetraspora sp. NBRC 16547]